jgi:hypothetical protein
MNIDDLRVLVEVIGTRGGDTLRFRCITCERNPDRPALREPIEGINDNPFTTAQSIYQVSEGFYPFELYTSGSRSDGFIVLPFHLETWRGHLLHDVRAEWNRAFISSRGVTVQAWEPKQGRTLWLSGG